MPPHVGFDSFRPSLSHILKEGGERREDMKEGEGRREKGGERRENTRRERGILGECRGE